MKLGLILASAMTLAVMTGCDSSNEEQKPGPVEFSPEGTSDGATIFLRGKTKGDRLSVEVVVRGATSIHGVAFRLTWDPDALTFSESVAANVWTAEAVMLAKEGTPGQLAVAWSEKGEGEGITLQEETILGTLSFDAKGHKACSLAFRPERSAVVDAAGKRVNVTWRGGSIPSR